MDEAGSRATLERVKSASGLANEAALVSGLAAVNLVEERASLLVSAPGKVILFGEHAVVHGVVCPSSLVHHVWHADDCINDRPPSLDQSLCAATA